MPKLGLVTVLYKSDSVLEGFFKSIAAQDYKNYVLYIIDNSANAETVGLIQKLKNLYPVSNCKYIDSGGNPGVAAGNNIGIKAALKDECSHILLLNNDIETEQDKVLSRLMAVSEEQNQAIVIPKIYYYDSRLIWMAGGYMSKWRALGIHYGYGKKDSPRYSVPRKVTYAPTCFMLISKKVFDEVGLMDEKYFAYYDDTDFVLRAGKKGYSIYYEPSVSILHKVSSSSGGDDSLFYIYYSNRNKIYFARKNLSGIVKFFALSSTVFIRFFYLFKYNKLQRQKLIQGIKDGFLYPVADEIPKLNQ